MTTDKISGGANNKQIKRKRLNSMGPASSKHPKTLTTPKNANKS